MPQKPTMPSPYMTTVDANEPITLSCEISSKDTIVDYEFEYRQIKKNETNSKSDINNKLSLPSKYIGQYKVYCSFQNNTSGGLEAGKIDIYFDEKSNEYVAVINISQENAVYFVDTNYSLSIESTCDVPKTKITKIIYRYANQFSFYLPIFKGFKNLRQFIFDGFEGYDAFADYSVHTELSINSPKMYDGINGGHLIFTCFIGQSIFQDCPLLTEIEFPHIAHGTPFDSEDKAVYDYGYVDGRILNGSNIKKLTIANAFVFGSSRMSKYRAKISYSLFAALPKSVEELVFTKNIFPKIYGYFDGRSASQGDDWYNLLYNNYNSTAINYFCFNGISNNPTNYITTGEGINTVKKITFLQQVTKIGERAFENFSNLSEIVGLDAVTEIGNYAFSGCEKIGNILESMSDVTKIGGHAFSGSNMTNLIITDKMKSISIDTFHNCGMLSNIELMPRTLKTDTNGNKTEDTSLFSQIGDSYAYFNGCGCVDDDGEFTSDKVIKLFYHEKYETYNNLITALNSSTLSDETSRLKYKTCTIYEKDGYSHVPIYGGSDNTIWSVRLNEKTLENDCEYYWTVTLKDSLGKEVTSPQYYFKTRCAPTAKINQLSTSFTRELVLDEQVEEVEFSAPDLIESSVQVTTSDGSVLPTTYSDGKIKHIYINKLVLELESSITGYKSPRIVYTGNDTKKNVSYLEIDKSIKAEKLNMALIVSDRQTDEDGNVIEVFKTVNITWKPKEEDICYELDGMSVCNREKVEGQYILDTEDSNYEDILDTLNNLPMTEAITDAEGTTENVACEYDFTFNLPFSKGKYTISYYRNNIAYPHEIVFNAEYKMSGIGCIYVPVKYHRWRLYEIDDSTGLVKQTLIDDTGEIYSAYLRYSYDKFISGKKYELDLEIENDEGMTANNTYSFEIINIENDLSVDFPTVISDKSINAIAIDFTECEDEDVKYTVIRHNITDSSYTTITEEGYCGQKFYDFTAASHKKYEYIIYAFKDGKMTTHTTDTIIPDWCKTTVIGFNGSYASTKPFEVNPEDIWTFELNISKRDFTQNIHKEVRNAVGSRYPRITAGKTNYKSFELSGLFGHAKNGNYSGDDIDKIEKWERFVASSTAKLVVDTKGNVSVCDITDSKYGYEDNYIEQPTTISVSFTEIAPSDRVSLIMVE